MQRMLELMQEKCEMTSKKSMPRYHIKLNAKTVITVTQDMLFTRQRWLVHFGTFEAIQKFIDTYNEEHGCKSS